MDVTFNNITYYTDSKVVLGYIHNQSRRFYVYVHNLLKLHPVMDCDGLLRVGRIGQSSLGMDETHPMVIPGRHHLAALLMHHHHKAVKHQGRHLT
ncbi:hypothetical protein N1851_015946 [Merluccius polli]|uniref:Uncharacterized protein n=1 Tax=Merluccius polli TaxID=89951 RepID=A0AA47MS26_MERPO|nr:hypothetical protein N1851_015946 [Merluccius polli]